MIKFGTGGWRAIVADGFTKSNVQLLVSALCMLMKEEGVADRGLCIGYDRRFLSFESARWAAEVVAAHNIPCMVLDREAPTPLIMYTVREYGLPYGMAVTASHNPAIYNGIKVFSEGGRDASEEVTDKIELNIAALEGCSIPFINYEDALSSGLIREIDTFNKYVDSILSMVDTEAIKNSRLKIALDPMYGVSRTSLRTILLTTRCEVEVIHERHDTLFGGKLPSPNKDTLNTLSQFVVDNRCNLGIATDGDADRIGVIDDTGEFLHPNKLLVLLYYYLLKYRGWKGPAVRNISTTHLLDRVADSFGEKCYEVPVGFKHISAMMEKTNAVIGGESSGGLTVRGHIRGKDGIYAATLLAEMMSVTGKRLSELFSEITDCYGMLYTADIDITMTPQRKQELSDVLFIEKRLPSFEHEVKFISYADGCKVYFTNGGWVIARFSGTEPLLRICAEMDTVEAATECIQQLKSTLFM